MMKYLLVVFSLIALVNADQWAVIVAGSNGYYNYRHQADALHAYHIMVKNGIAPERIITMMYDDVAHSSENPTPGVIINKPNGPNVYANVSIDYRQRSVTPKTFTNVLLGNKRALKDIGTGRVLESGPNDHVFINFVDHGAPGLVAFPSGILTAKLLNETINEMYKRNMYKEMVLYVEACESGSMFNNILSDKIKVFATTAANGRESSYACYFSDKYNTYLGDMYSVMWMEDSDVENLNKETLEDQFKIVKRETNTSHVQQFGDMAISKEPLSTFQAEPSKYVYQQSFGKANYRMDAVKSEDVPMQILSRKLAKTNSHHERKLLLDEMTQLYKLHEHIRQVSSKIVHHSLADTTEIDIDSAMDVHLTLTKYQCYEDSMWAFNQHCFNLNKYEYALRQLYKLVNLCEMGVSKEMIINSITSVCVHM